MSRKKEENQTEINELLDKVKDMEGKLFFIMASRERILHHWIEDGAVHIKTDKKVRAIDLPKLKEFMEGVEPISEGLAVVHEEKNSSQLQVIFEASGMSELQKKLMDTMDKVDADPEYVKQAYAVNNLAKTIVNMTNTKIQFLKNQK
ncbi:MAG: hypothetical protein JWO03_905 [Bacteroidetes bacterium]|nr:hypothetical protein [Bacteroidota bacterium]